MIVEWDAPVGRMSTFASAYKCRRGALVTRLVGIAVAVVAVVVTGLVALPQAALADSPSATPNVIQYVDPFVSTQGDHGNDLPGAEAPNSLAKVNPMTYPGRDHSGYDYAQSEIEGFTNTNLDGVGGSGGAGDISPSSLEASTVDLSAEFSGLITTQRAYSASSKIITTADQMLQDLINIIR